MSTGRCGKSLVEPRFLGPLEGYVVVDTFESVDANEVRVLAFVRNYGVDKDFAVELDVCGNTVYRRVIRLLRGERQGVELYVDAKKDCTARLAVNGSTLDAQKIDVRDTSSLENPTNVLMVLHNHQPPNYCPRSVYRGLWPFTYVWEPILFPYGLGPYYYQAILLKEVGFGVKLVYNISPSLIRQWRDIVETGIKTITGEIISPHSELAKVVKETMNIYQELASSGVIEVLTSIYAHTIAGYVVDVLGLGDLIRREVEYGYNITEEFTGSKPKGIWLPEMSFSMNLISILKSQNLEYTFLDERYHFNGAKGDIGDHYEPYVVQDSSGNTLTVLFRDTELSNDVGFANNYCSDIHAVKGAYAFMSKLVDKCARNRAKVLTIALDGENWMAFSKNPPATAVFLETVLLLLKRLGKLGLAKLTTAEEVLRSTPPVRKLWYVPSTTWLGSYTKWKGERVEHEVFWEMVERRIARYKEYILKHGLDEKAVKAEWALWHVLDSDYWWAEFWDEEMITLWISEFDRHIP
ncbi:MAG: hypothetical protein QXH02_01830 [Desulfurococcaceae archaeon]